MKTLRVKKYKCPYCELRASRTDLVEHIDTDHQVFIPENHTAARIVFNIARNKYRLIAAFNYEFQLCFVKYIGTHTEYIV